MMAATLSLPLSAQAQVRAEGSLSNFSYTLVDLLPDDGIAPSLTIARPSGNVGGSGASGSASQHAEFEPWFVDSRNQQTNLYKRDVAIDIGNRAGASSASVSGTDFSSLQLRTMTSTTSIAAASRAGTASASSYITEFVLSPGTQVSFFADLYASTVTTLPAGNVLRENARTYTSFSLDATAQDGWRKYASNFIDIIASNGTYPNSPPTTASASERVSLTLGNDSLFSSKLSLYITLNSTVDVYDASPVTPNPVPEPATAAMLMAGLALVAGAVRRRRKRQDQ